MDRKIGTLTATLSMHPVADSTGQGGEMGDLVVQRIGVRGCQQRCKRPSLLIDRVVFR
jgi:hypothetical protein